MKTLIVIVLLIMLAGCKGGGESTPGNAGNTPVENDVEKAVKPPYQAATEVVIYPLQDKYLNGLRDVSGAADELTVSNWESLCETENPTNKEYAFPMASVYIVEKVGFTAEDTTHANYIRDNWYYGVDMNNADVLDRDGAVVSNDFNWLIVQNTVLGVDFMPVDATQYLSKKMISAGHLKRLNGTTMGTLLDNAGTIQAMFNTLDTVSINYFCMAF